MFCHPEVTGISYLTCVETRFSRKWCRALPQSASISGRKGIANYGHEGEGKRTQVTFVSYCAVVCWECYWSSKSSNFSQAVDRVGNELSTFSQVRDRILP